jgi:hypothetical protein
VLGLAAAGCTILADFDGLTCTGPECVQSGAGAGGGSGVGGSGTGAGNAGGSGAGNVGGDAQTGGNGGGHGASGGGGGGVPTCVGSQAIICDSFEAPLLDTSTWFEATAGGTVTIDSVHVNSGERALHLHVNPVAQGEFGHAFIGEGTLSATADQLYARGYFYFPELSSMSFNLMGYGQGSDPFAALDVLVAPAGNLQLFQSVSGQTQLDLGATPPIGEWFCVEWLVRFEPDERVRLWFENDESTDFDPAQPTVSDPRMQFFQVGPLFYYPPSNLPAFDMWVDDVVVDSSPIGCP